jgi:hypothetical protein
MHLMLLHHCHLGSARRAATDLADRRAILSQCL